MMSDTVNKETVETIYRTLRKAEWQNDRTGEFDEKKMVERIEKYRIKKAKEEVENN